MGRKAAFHDENGKVCRGCDTYKLYSDYYNAPKGIGGKVSRCKDCIRESQQAARDADPEGWKEYCQNYYANNKEQMYQNSLKWKRNNPDKHRAHGYKSIGYVPKNPRKHTPGINDERFNVDGNE